VGTPQFDFMNHLCSVHETGMNVMSVEVSPTFWSCVQQIYWWQN